MFIRDDPKLSTKTMIKHLEYDIQHEANRITDLREALKRYEKLVGEYCAKQECMAEALGLEYVEESTVPGHYTKVKKGGKS